MTSPALNQNADQQHQLNPAEKAAVAAIAAYLATRAAVSAVRLPGALVGRLTALGLSQRAVRLAGRMTLEPALTGRNRWGSPTRPDVGSDTISAARLVASDEPMWRARYLLNAAKRLTTALTVGDLAQAVKREKRYLSQHRAAGLDRRAGAKQVDQVLARTSSPYLVWVGGTCDECRPLDGQVFRVGATPLPPRHLHCHCSVRPL